MALHLEIEADKLMLRTSAYATRRGSMLHSGVFSRELSASLAAGAVVILLALVSAGHLKMTAVHYIAAICIFGVLFMLFRIFIFREPLLEAAFDRREGLISIIRRGIGREKRQSYALTELQDITIQTMTFEPGNSDGIAVVEKIALQHGTVIPGFGQSEVLHTVRLEFPEQKVTIFSTRVRQEAEAVRSRIIEYLGMGLFHTLKEA